MSTGSALDAQVWGRGAGGVSDDFDDDAADAARAAKGDVRAFERLHRRNAERVHVLARRFLGPTDADDATQDVFVRAWEKLALFRGESTFATWLHRLAVNVLLRRAEVARAARRREVDVDEGLASRAAASDAAMDVHAALARLEDGLREVVVLHDMEGYAHDEIAHVLGITVGASRMRLHRARTVLRAWIAR